MLRDFKIHSHFYPNRQTFTLKVRTQKLVQMIITVVAEIKLSHGTIVQFNKNTEGLLSSSTIQRNTYENKII